MLNRNAFMIVTMPAIAIVALVMHSSSHKAVATPHRITLANPSQSKLSIIPSGTIDGAKTPWLIPDSVAYRLFFETVAERTQPTDDEVRRQRSRLTGIELTDEEYKAVVTALSEFKTADEALRFKYSDIAEHGGIVDEATVLSERDAIVQGTRTHLTERISAQAVASLDARIQSEKSKMKIIPNPPME
jgi:hypothetical protein